MSGPVPPELVVLVGLPGSGKTTFFRSRFADTHVHVSKDLMPNVRDRNRRQLELVRTALAAGRSVVVDNVNPRLEDRAPLLATARAAGARVVGYLIDTDARECLQRNRSRRGRAQVPAAAIFVARKRLQTPTSAEGFDSVFRVRAQGGTFQVGPLD